MLYEICKAQIWQGERERSSPPFVICGLLDREAIRKPIIHIEVRFFFFSARLFCFCVVRLISLVVCVFFVTLDVLLARSRYFAFYSVIHMANCRNIFYAYTSLQFCAAITFFQHRQTRHEKHSIDKHTYHANALHATGYSQLTKPTTTTLKRKEISARELK